MFVLLYGMYNSISMDKIGWYACLAERGVLSEGVSVLTPCPFQVSTVPHAAVETHRAGRYAGPYSKYMMRYYVVALALGG